MYWSSTPALEITSICAEYNAKLRKEGKPLCTKCIEACPYKRKPIFRDPVSVDVTICRHCLDAPCLKACKEKGKGAMEEQVGGIIVIQSALCSGCLDKPCIRACPWRAIREIDGHITKCDLCYLYQQEKGMWGIKPKCFEACPVKAIRYLPPRAMLWLRLGGVEIETDPPPKEYCIERRLPITTGGGEEEKKCRVEIYRLPGESNYLWFYRIPTLRHPALSDYTNHLLENKMAAMLDYLIRHLNEYCDVKISPESAEYIGTEAYRAIEREIKRAVYAVIPERRYGIGFFEHRDNKVIIQPGREEGRLVLNIYEVLEADEQVKEGGGVKIIDKGGKKYKHVKIVFSDYIIDFIADIVDSLTHGPGALKRMLEDDNLEEIAVNGVAAPGQDIRIWVYDKNYRWMKTNIIPRSLEMMKRLADRLAAYSGENIKLDPTHPIIHGTLPWGERLTAVGPLWSLHGISITIRKFILTDVSPVWFCREKKDATGQPIPPAISVEGMAYLWQFMEAGGHCLIGGATGSGKSTLLNIMTEFIPPDDRTVVVQDVIEILPWQPNTVMHVVRPWREESMERIVSRIIEGAVLRERPSRLIVGELRGGEAKPFFGSCIAAGGAPKGALATIHVDSVDKLIERVRFEPMGIPPVQIPMVDLIVLTLRTENPFRKGIIRSVVCFAEIERKLTPEGGIKTYETWKYDYRECDFLPVEGVRSRVLEDMMRRLGVDADTLLSLIEEKCAILYYLLDKGVDKGSEFVQYVRRYYAPPEKGEKISKERQQLLDEAFENLTTERRKRIRKIINILKTQLP